MLIATEDGLVVILRLKIVSFFVDSCFYYSVIIKLGGSFTISFTSILYTRFEEQIVLSFDLQTDRHLVL